MRLRSDIKHTAKDRLHSNLAPMMMLFLPLVILNIINSSSAAINIVKGNSVNFTSTLSIFLISLIIVVLEEYLRIILLEFKRYNNSKLLTWDNIIKFIFNSDNLGYFGIALIKQFYLFLWALIPFVGGFISIVKSYSYYMSSYIYYDYEVDSLTDAITESRKMMDGYKFKLFIQHLSFILWLILTGLTAGILSIYVSPYMVLADIEFYEDLSK